MRLPQRAAPSLARALASARKRAAIGEDANSGLRSAPVFEWLRRAVETHSDPIEQRPPRHLTWSSRLLLIASVAVPMLLFAVAAWQNYRLVKIQAEQRVRIETRELEEHALRALETYSLVLAWIDGRIFGLDWDSIEYDRRLRRLLSDIETLPQIGSVSIVDTLGHIRASEPPLVELPEKVFAHDAFVAQESRDAGVFVGRTPAHHPTAVSFEISRRRSTADGSFDGVIIVSARPDYFSDFFSTVSAEKNFSASLVRRDGALLVRYPPLPGPFVFNADQPIMKAIAAELDHGLFWGRGATDGIERLLGYRHLAGYPLYIVFGIPTGGVLASWRANLVDYLVFAVPASLGLFCMTLFAVRQLHQQKFASWRWRSTAQRLQGEMDRRIKAEADLHQAQKMEALGQLTGSVSHDFNNMLTVLQGCLELLSGRQHDQKLQARVEMALATIKRGEKLTRHLLAFARRQPLEVTRVGVNDLLRRMHELLVQTLGSDISTASELAPDLWPVNADDAQLELVVINLAINARDAMPTGGELRVRTYNTTILPGQLLEEDMREGGDFVVLEIADTGSGMPPDVAARAFEPFFTSKPPGKGTGLGLSIVYGFARQSGGWTTIRSEVGHGTSVTIFLPRSREPDESND